MKQSKLRQGALAVLAAAAVAVPASSALGAADPEKGGAYADNSGTTTIGVNKKGSKLTLIFTAYDCHPVPLFAKAKIKENGKFAYKGEVKKDAAGNRDIDGEVKVKGKFKSKGEKAKVKTKYTSGKCTDKTKANLKLQAG